MGGNGEMSTACDFPSKLRWPHACDDFLFGASGYLRTVWSRHITMCGDTADNLSVVIVSHCDIYKAQKDG